MRILASDVGGTHVRLAFVEERNRILSIVEHETLSSRDFQSFEDAVSLFLARHPGTFDVAAFSIAAPIIGGRAKFPNLPWTLSKDSVELALGKESIFLLNDLEAQAYGLGDMQPKDVEVLHAGTPELNGNWALVAPGTGLGQAMVSRRAETYGVVKSEGGHVDFGARNELEFELLLFLEKEMDHVSWEAVLSGPGLVRLYRFLKEKLGVAESPRIEEALTHPNPSVVISRAGVSGESTIAARAVELFVELLAGFAGNLALSSFASGGVYLGGGIVPHLLPQLKLPGFHRTFCHKGRMSSFLENIPVQVLLSDMVGILGAARYAEMRLKRRHDRGEA